MKIDRTGVIFGFILLFCVSVRPAQALEAEEPKTDTPAETKVSESEATPSAATEETKSIAPAEPSAPSIPGLEDRIANNKSMTDEEKVSLIDAMKQQFPEKTDFRDVRLEKEVLFFEQTSNDPNMKIEEKIAAIEKHFTTQPPQEPLTVKEDKPAEAVQPTAEEKPSEARLAEQEKPAEPEVAEEEK